jgi:hypothetical protein
VNFPPTAGAFYEHLTEQAKASTEQEAGFAEKMALQGLTKLLKVRINKMVKGDLSTRFAQNSSMRHL